MLLRLSRKAKNVKARNNNDISRKEYMFSFADMPRLMMYSATSGSEAWCGPHCVQSRFYSAGRMKYLRGPQVANRWSIHLSGGTIRQSHVEDCVVHSDVFRLLRSEPRN